MITKVLRCSLCGAPVPERHVQAGSILDLRAADQLCEPCFAGRQLVEATVRAEMDSTLATRARWDVN